MKPQEGVSLGLQQTREQARFIAMRTLDEREVRAKDEVDPSVRPPRRTHKL